MERFHTDHTYFTCGTAGDNMQLLPEMT